jgi:hypothetical protein
VTRRHHRCIDNPSKIADRNKAAPVSRGVFSSANDDDGGGFHARLREQQSSDKNVTKNTSDHSGLRSLSGLPEF